MSGPALTLVFTFTFLTSRPVASVGQRSTVAPPAVATPDYLAGTGSYEPSSVTVGPALTLVLTLMFLTSLRVASVGQRSTKAPPAVAKSNHPRYSPAQL